MRVSRSSRQQPWLQPHEALEKTVLKEPLTGTRLSATSCRAQFEPDGCGPRDSGSLSLTFHFSFPDGSLKPGCTTNWWKFKMLKHMISPGNGVAPGTPGDRTNHSIDSYSSERNLERSHLERTFQNASHLDRNLYGNSPYVINGHIPNVPDGMMQGRIPNGHVHSPHTPQPSQPSQPLNINVQRLNHSHAMSTLSTSKHSLGGGTSSSVSPGVGVSTILPPVKLANGGLSIPRMGTTNLSRSPNGSILLANNVTRFITKSKEAGVKEMLTTLGLLCLVSLLLALLSLTFLLKITPVTAGEVKDFLRTEQLTIISPEEYVVVYEITLALCSLTLSLNLCCLLVCAVQFLFAVKLVKAAEGGERTNKYLQKSNITRICAVGGFFISIPVFLTGKFWKCCRAFSYPHWPNNCLGCCRDYFVHVHSIPLDARYYHKFAHRSRHHLLRMCHGSQCLRLADGKSISCINNTCLKRKEKRPNAMCWLPRRRQTQSAHLLNRHRPFAWLLPPAPQWERRLRNWPRWDTSPSPRSSASTVRESLRPRWISVELLTNCRPWSDDRLAPHAWGSNSKTFRDREQSSLKF